MSGRGRRERRLQQHQGQSPAIIQPPAAPAQVAGAVMTVAAKVWQSWQGPLPAPGDLAAYDRIVPGAAERILATMEEHTAMTRAQMEHRHRLEGAAVESGILLAKRGQACAFTLAMFVMGIGGMAIYLGRDVAGLTAMLSALGVLVGVFLAERKRQGGELAAKRKEIDRAVQVADQR